MDRSAVNPYELKYLEQSKRNQRSSKIGRAFQENVKIAFEEILSQEVLMEYKQAIGNPAKMHSFDLVSEDNHVFIECKYRSWGTNITLSSGTRKAINEDVLHLKLLGKNKRKIICLSKTEVVNNQGLTLAQEYYRIYSYLLENEIELYELSKDSRLKRIDEPLI